MKTVLIIAEHFPPSFAVGGKRPYRFARYLPEHGWRPIILTGPQPGEERSDTTPHPLPDEAVLDRSLLPDWWPEPKGRPSDGTNASPTQDRVAKPSMLHSLRNQFHIPLGAKRFLRPWMLKRIKSLVNTHNVDAIYATSSPYFLLDLGAAAKAQTGLPLCLDLRDPWSLNFLQRNKPAWFRKAEGTLEHRSFQAADRVLLTCEKAAQAYREKYRDLPQGHIQTIYNSFDPALAPDPFEGPIEEGPIDLMHFGNCYGPRKLKTVIQAIAKLREAEAPGAERLRLFNLGRPAQMDLDLLDELGLENALHWEPYVPYSQGIQRLSSAPLQLLLAYGEETLYIPAKTFDYFLSGAPTLCLSESDELGAMITDTGSGFSARPHDVDAVANVLGKVLDAAAEGKRACEARREDVARFSSPHTAGQLATVLNEITTLKD